MTHIIGVPESNDQGPLLNLISLALYIAAVFFVALRFITRACLVKKFGLDDWFIGVAVMLGGLQTVTMFKQVENGRGKHAKELHVENFNEMLKYSWLNMLTYFVAIWTVKMSILALYYRIGSGLGALPWILQARAVWITAALMTATAVASFLAQLLACIPVTRTWNIQQQPEGCINGPLFMQISAAINITTDVAMFLIPLPLLPLMKFNKKQRTALVLIFSIGLIPVIASTMRLCKIIMAGNPVAEGKSWQDGDSSWTWAWVPIWSQIEVDVGIIVASLPSLNPPLKQVWTGTGPRRALTPSQLPDFPQYQGQRKSWEGPDENVSDIEKSVKGGEVAFHDDGSDTEDEVDVAKTTMARVTVYDSAEGTESTSTWFEYMKL